MIQLENVSKSFSTGNLFSNVNLALRKGMTWRLKEGHTRTYEWNLTHTAYCDDVFWSDKAYFD